MPYIYDQRILPIGNCVHEVFEYNVSTGLLDDISEDDFDVPISIGTPILNPIKPRKRRISKSSVSFIAEHNSYPKLGVDESDMRLTGQGLFGKD